MNDILKFLQHLTFEQSALLAFCVFWVLLPPKYDPAIRLKIWLERKNGERG
jgi:hypothetical protein